MPALVTRTHLAEAEVEQGLVLRQFPVGDLVERLAAGPVDHPLKLLIARVTQRLLDLVGTLPYRAQRRVAGLAFGAHLRDQEGRRLEPVAPGRRREQRLLVQRLHGWRQVLDRVVPGRIPDGAID